MYEHPNARYLRLKPRFDLVWKEEAEEGHCDAWGGDEYRRVLQSWFWAGSPSEIREYIQREANRGAES